MVEHPPNPGCVILTPHDEHPLGRTAGYPPMSIMCPGVPNLAEPAPDDGSWLCVSREPHEAHIVTSDDGAYACPGVPAAQQSLSRDDLPPDVRDAAWQAYLSEDTVTGAIDAAIRATYEAVTARSTDARDRILTRHAKRPDGKCVMCRWADGSVAEWPCPDYLDAQALADPAVRDARVRADERRRAMAHALELIAQYAVGVSAHDPFYADTLDSEQLSFGQVRAALAVHPAAPAERVQDAPAVAGAPPERDDVRRLRTAMAEELDALRADHPEPEEGRTDA